VDELLKVLRDELRGAARFRWPAMVIAWCVCVLGWVVVFLLPNQYESSARVFVDTRTALSSVIQGLAIQDDIGSYLNLARESLVSTARLDELINKTGLGSKALTPAKRAKLIDQLRGDIDVQVAPTGDRKAAEPSGFIYTIKYRDSNRARSLQVVEILLNSFVEGTLGGKRQGSETADSFLSKQVAEYEQRLHEGEQRLAEFKKHNVGVMPGVEGDYFTRLQNEMDAGTKARTALSVAIARRDELIKQRRGEAPYAVAAGGAPATGADGALGRPGAGSDTPAQIADAQRRLAAPLLRFTEKHPDVSAVREEIANLEQRRAREIEAVRRGDPDAALASGAGSNPIYQSIQLALNGVEVQIAELRGEIGQHESKITQLRNLVNSVPEVEAEFARLNRDYEVTKTQYAALVERLKKAKLSQDAEATSAVRFDLLDPPAASFRPVAPKRSLLVFLVFVGGLLGGAGVAFGLHKAKPVFNDAHDIYAVTGLPVLGEVSHVTLREFVEQARRGYLRLLGTAAGLFMAFVATMWLSVSRIFA
jgi:polysaccharide chain length determinant protein (PEP-CTERM system associated)